MRRGWPARHPTEEDPKMCGPNGAVCRIPRRQAGAAHVARAPGGGRHGGVAIPRARRRTLLAAVLLVQLALPALAAAGGEGTIAFKRNKLVENKAGAREVRSVWLMRGDGTRLRQVRPPIDGLPVWLAGGRRLGVGLTTMSRAGEGRQRFAINLPESARRVDTFAFAPDASWIAFDYYSPDADTTSLWLAPAAGPERQLSLGDAATLCCPAWSPDGTTIAAVGGLPPAFVQPFPNAPFYEIRRIVGVWLLDPDGGASKRLASWQQAGHLQPSEVAWSPDRGTLAIANSIETPPLQQRTTTRSCCSSTCAPATSANGSETRSRAPCTRTWRGPLTGATSVTSVHAERPATSGSSTAARGRPGT
jgi:WD40-like Beta Propeller Repeat